MKHLLQAIGGLFALLTVQYFFKAFITLNFNVLFGPSVAQFWRHAKHYAHPDDKHPEKSAVRCPDCRDDLMSMPD